MCVDYTDLNWSCSKDSYPLSNTDKLVNNLVGYKILLCMGVYSRYNQIPMFGPYRREMTFMNKQSDYQYNGMSFGLENMGARAETPPLAMGSS